MKIGVLSDTHGVLKDNFISELKNCDYIIHSGDFNTERCYLELKNLGVPMYMVRGNCDYGNWAKYLPETLTFPIEGQIFYLIHDLSKMSLIADEPDVIIFGHTHHRTCYEKRGCLYLNPGSAGFSRGEETSIAILEIQGKKTEWKYITSL